MDTTERPTRMAIFRGADGQTLEEAKNVRLDTVTPFQMESLGRLYELGLAHGEDVRMLCNFPGFSLAYIWFKKDYPLPLHKHDTDCLYYIISGSLHLGTETLGPRDTFFLPADVPYTYRPGENGVELLEFRHETSVGIWLTAKTSSFWDKAAALVEEKRDEWAAAKRPSELTA